LTPGTAEHDRIQAEIDRFRARYQEFFRKSA
jgi:hypothetical protein